MKNVPTNVFSIFPAAAAKFRQLCPTLCDPTDGSPPGSPVPGILQARTLEWLAISFSSAWKWKVKVKLLSCVQLLRTPWTATYQAPPSMGFSRQEYIFPNNSQYLFFFFNFRQFTSTLLCSYWATMLNPRETKMNNIQFMSLFLRIQRGHKTNSWST